MRLPKVTGYDGQYDKLIENDPFGGTVFWSPGDATQYCLVARRLEYDEARALSSSPGSMIVSLSTDQERWTTVIMVEGNLYHLDYFMGKVYPGGPSVYTMTAYVALLNMVLGNESYGETLAKKLKER